MRLAELLAHDPRYAVTTSLAGRTSAPRLPPGALRRGGFGGADGLATYLREQGIAAVVDATHPFAAQISRNAVDACSRLGTPLVRLVRPAWQASAGDLWIPVDTVETAAACLPSLGRRAFLTVGRQEIAAFRDCADTWFLVRLIEAPTDAMPLPNATLVLARGPFREEDEVALMTAHSIDVLVTKNSGGGATYAKIAAARRLALKVLMVRRPILPPAEEVAAPERAAQWLEARLG